MSVGFFLAVVLGLLVFVTLGLGLALRSAGGTGSPQGRERLEVGAVACLGIAAALAVAGAVGLVVAVIRA